VVHSLRQAVATWTNPPRLVFVSRGSVAESEAFFARHWPGCRVISDPSGEWFRAYGVPRAGCLQLFAWRAWVSALRATLKGHCVSRPTRDIWQMPAYVLVDQGEVRWSFYPREPGEQPRWTPPPWHNGPSQAATEG
jgi:hypothetical protein